MHPCAPRGRSFLGRLRGAAFALFWLFAGAVVCSAQVGSQSTSSDPTAVQWQPFTVPKPPEELKTATADNVKPSDAIREHLRLPPQHDTLRTTVGVGYVMQNDWGVELGASGRVGGLQTNLNSFLTLGNAGVEMPSGSLSVVAPHAGWRAEAGDVISELRGLARGVRFAWGKGRWHTPMLSLYLPSARLQDRTTTVGYRDEVRLFSRVVAGGEVTSDGSHFARTGYLGRRFDVQASYRRMLRDSPSRHAGITASYNVGHGVMLQAGLSGFETPTDRDTWRLLSARLPLGKMAALTIEDTRSNHRGSAGVSNAISIQLLRGPVRLTQRYQWGNVETFHVGDALSLQQRQLQTSASFNAARWASFSPQTVTQWLPDGRAQQWQELQSDFSLSRTTRLQLSTSVPRVFDATRFRSRLTQDLRNQLSLIVEYGRVSPYQNTIASFANEPRFSLMLRKTWKVPTPAYGGVVSGVVTDQRGTPVEGVAIRLGTFVTMTDASGRYVFAKVPQGEFDLRIPQEWLPAQYASDGLAQRIGMRGTAHHVVDFKIVPLDSIRGHVYQDRNGNGRFDTGEGRPGIVVHLDSQVTATDTNGAYGFYNLPPGDHLVRLDVDRLAPSLEAVSSATAQVSLQIGQAATGIDFALAEKQKPVILQRWMK